MSGKKKRHKLTFYTGEKERRRKKGRDLRSQMLYKVPCLSYHTEASLKFWGKGVRIGFTLILKIRKLNLNEVK